MHIQVRWLETLPARVAPILAALSTALATAPAAAQETKVLNVARRVQFETLDPARIQDGASSDLVSLVPLLRTVAGPRHRAACHLV